MTADKRITAERLREILSYDPITGCFTWRAARPKCTPGAQAGYHEPSRYVVIRVDYVRQYAHRLAWLYMTGEWPPEQIDHVNRDKSDNRWCNLREATQKQNSENMATRPQSRSGCRGVTWNRFERKWVARITHNRIKITLGYFKNMNEAIACRKAAERELFTHFFS